MKRCILHFGMPKTGTSSIQESLFFGLEDRRFHYVGFGEGNGSRAVATLFGTDPYGFFLNRYEGLGRVGVMRLRRRLMHRLETSIQAGEGRDSALVISAEHCWGMPQEELSGIAAFFRTRGYEMHVVVYLRPWKEWLESVFQQMVKLGRHRFIVMPEERGVPCAYEARVCSLESTFGSNNVEAVLYEPGRFPDGCVVRDFCVRTGIAFDGRRIRRMNDGLSADAIKLLYAYRCFGGAYRLGRWAAFENQELIRRLGALPGPGLRFHSSVLEPYREFIERDSFAIEARLGCSFSAELQRDDEGPCVRRESDLFEFSEASLRWLACQVSEPPIRERAGEDAARAVARQMSQLRRSPTILGAMHAMRSRASREWRQLTRHV